MGSLLSIYQNTEQAKIKNMTDLENEEFYDAEDEIHNSDKMNVNEPNNTRTENQEGLVTDAVESKFIRSRMTASNITDEMISDIENHLKYYEKVSLTFLLYDNVDTALQALLVEQANLKRGMSNNILSNWAKSEAKEKSKHVSTSPWQNRIIEALCVIQNYAVLRRLGFEKEEVKVTYLPSQPYTTLHLNRVMKALYCLCESLTYAETIYLKEELKREFIRLKFPFDNLGEDQLELYLLHCFSMKYITKDDLSNLIGILKRLQHHQQADMLECITRVETRSDEVKCRFDLTKPTENYATQNQPTCSQNSVIGDNSIVKKISSKRVYDIIDPKNVGICLIINQKKFYKEDRKSCENMERLFEPKHNLEERHGTDIDRDSLATLFDKLGFKIVIEENLHHKEVIPIIKRNMKEFSKNHSCFFVCILSHGVENKIYGCNSLTVDIEDIMDALHDRQYPALLGKPKILIIQSCQGTELQKVYLAPEPDDNVIDGPHKNESDLNLINDPSGVPQKRDFLLCMSTVSGFASIRNKTQGSWYIQELCKIIDENCDDMHFLDMTIVVQGEMEEKAKREHFLDMMTMVSNDVSSKRWKKENEGIVTMVPENRHLTLCKQLYLRKVK